MTIFLPKISLQSKKFKHIAKYCHFYQFANLTIMLICVTPPEKEPLFQWAPIWGGCNRSACRSFIKVPSDHHRSGVVFEPLFKGRRKQGCKKTMVNPGERSSEGQRLESHTKTLMERASSRNQLHPLAND